MKFSFKYIFLVITFGFLLLPFSSVSQNIIKSVAEKVPGKFSDYEILGKNNWGTIVHYYGNNDHQFAIFDDQLHVLLRRDIPINDKSVTISDILVQPDAIQLFYTQSSSNGIYFKVRGIDNNLNLKNNIRILDSLTTQADDKLKYYVKTSPNQSRILTFTIVKKKDDVFVRFVTLDQNVDVTGRNMFTMTDEAETTVKSIKINNSGNVVCVFGHKSRWPNDEYEFEKYTVMLYNRETKTQSESSISGTEMLYKNLITEVNNDREIVYITACYKNSHERDDIGYIVKAIDFRTSNTVIDQKIPLQEKDVIQYKTFDFKNWQDKASIMKPRRLIPRSDGGFILVAEGEFKYTRVDRIQPVTYSYTYLADPNVRYTDQNHYYDIFVYSINKDGSIDWKVDMPKSQVSENDDGYYSSFAFLEANNVLKFFYNEDILSTGNFVEYNVNPLGKTKRVSVFNSEKEDVVLIPQKSKQIDGNSIIIPSEQKRVLQLVKFSY